MRHEIAKQLVKLYGAEGQAITPLVQAFFAKLKLADDCKIRFRNLCNGYLSYEILHQNVTILSGCINVASKSAESAEAIADRAKPIALRRKNSATY